MSATLKRALGHVRRPKPTIRWRLTLLYGGLFLVSGAGLLAITYTLVSHSPVTDLISPGQFAISAPAGPVSSGSGLPAQTASNQRFSSRPLPTKLRRLIKSRNGPGVLRFVGTSQRVSDLHQLIVESAIALAIMAIISTILGWLMAGRVLRPLRDMTVSTQQITEANLHERLAVAGPRDELRELADTIDALLARLEDAFGAQRRFVANASHELRTPLTAVRALLEMVLTDPRATITTFRAACRQVLEESEHQERLIEALLTLAQGQRGLDKREPVDLSRLVGDAWAARSVEAAAAGIESHLDLEPAMISGDAGLVERLVSNLLENAIRHNGGAGEIDITVEQRSGLATLSVANSGPAVPAADISRLLLPFQRLGPERAGHDAGVGLGLSIVNAVADAHGAGLELAPRPGGGLRVQVRFPALGQPAGTPATPTAKGQLV